MGIESCLQRLYRKMFEEEDEEEGDQPSEQNNAVFRSYTTGTIIVKENHLALEQAFPKPSSVTVMMKQPPGYDPNMGDWQFIQFDAYGNVLIDGNSQNPSVKLQCAFCHASMAERDYVFSTTVPLYKTKLRTFDMVE
ncbi:hypothetical protein C2W62_39525 [Candidatus Entotheonella serta]|nr:hypothetical protein C2W62_39525 [Candidatus Entotheonella serta]